MNDQDRLKHTFARFCWQHRDELAPNMEAGRKFNWAEIFFRRTGISLDAYVQQAKRERTKADT